MGVETEPIPLDEVVRRRMRRQPQRNTTPEVALRRALHRRGLRFRIDRSPLVGNRSRADIVFGPSLVAVFVDGCFWHSCPLHGTTPRHNGSWWNSKLAANAVRDRRVDEALRSSGWLSVRVWEHEDPEVAAEEIARVVQMRRRRIG